jgi:hypothetical protein
MPVLNAHRTPGPGRGYPLRGLGWGLLAAVVAALVLFATVLALDGRGGPAAAPAGPGSAAAAAGVAAQAGAAGPAPAAPAGTMVGDGRLAAGWAYDGWSWDSTVRPGSAGPDGVRAIKLTYLKPWAGFALRSATTTRPAAGAALQLRVRLSGPAIRLGLQVQSADNGRPGPVTQVLVPAGRWTTVSVPLSALEPPDGVRRVSVIAQGAPVGTELWIAAVTLR